MEKSEFIPATIITLFLIIVVFIVVVVGGDILSNSYNSIKDEVKQIKTMQKQIANIDKNTNEKLNNIETELNQLKNSNSRIVKVTVTFYCPAARGINSDSDHTKTATMTKPISGYTVAISKSLFEKGWLGCKIYVEGEGIFKIEDRMDKSIKGDCIDICIGTKKEALKKGKLYNITMVKL